MQDCVDNSTAYIKSIWTNDVRTKRGRCLRKGGGGVTPLPHFLKTAFY